MSSPFRLAIVLASDPGARMASKWPLALHEVGNLSLVGHVLSSVARAGIERTAVIVGPDMEGLATEVARRAPDASCHVQTEEQGGAQALADALAAHGDVPDQVIVLLADRPFIMDETLMRLSSRLGEEADVVMLGSREGQPENVRPSGIMALAGARFAEILSRIDAEPGADTGDLSDVTRAVQALGLVVVSEIGGDAEVRRVGTRADLAAVEAHFQATMRAEAMEAGATLIAPDTVFFSHDTRLGQDALIEPNVVFGPGVSVADGARIRAFSHLETASVGQDATVGPYARLRPGAEIGKTAHVGNFVEIKNATVEAGAKVNHLSYIGDARVGEKANIGAGTITCNYDGFLKHHTDIGAGAFVGSNSTLVAPLTLGDGAYLAAGGVVTEDVPADGLAIARARQVLKEGRGAQLRARFARAKVEKAGN
ncbi:NTP transferase domain-containing protein [Stappia sp. ES.058]|uniref:NTP transferase domain-containing protein n=1 Tax=Stappia sp. ES.058 TaxID=1881061 RepID=UPI00087B06BB|nr:NTP transferase domain-containing protein [Stappia sp. ES.058]SDU10054.1 bifunctional UDP-N-acetylglucosamine pyrophosphorylase / Glucosamine-1-phosphate N-acetyltransferase [Stappia sp. ES.058]